MDALVLHNRYLLARIVRALLGYGFGLGGELRKRDELEILDSELLVKVEAVALNPVDNLCIDLVGRGNSILGCDFSGTVVAVGSSIKNWKVGDRAAGFVHGGMYPDQGAFATHLKVDADLCWTPPDSMRPQEAATYGLAAATAMQGLNIHLEIPWIDTQQPAEGKKTTILIYAAAAATGLFATQLAKAAGYTVVAICSPRNFELVKGYGADYFYDYHDPQTLATVKREHPIVDLAFDAVSNDTTTTFCSKILVPEKGRLVVLLDTRKTAKRFGIKADWIMVFSLFGKPFQWLPPLGPSFEASPQERQALVRFYSLLPHFVDKIKPLPVLEVGQGIGSLATSLERLKKEKVSGQKMVVTL